MKTYNLPRLGLTEVTAAKLCVIYGAWPASYRSILESCGMERVPDHVRQEAAVMKRRRDAGDEDWRAGSGAGAIDSS